MKVSNDCAQIGTGAAGGRPLADGRGSVKCSISHLFRSRLRHLGMAVLAGAVLATTGCQAPFRSAEPMRAIWVTRFDYKTPADVAKIMDNCADGGFNTVLFQVRGNGTVSYASQIEPWAEQFDFKNPGFDPLAMAVREAHSRGMALHAWVNVMPAWRGPGEPKPRNQLYHAHPDWFWYDAAGKRQPIRHQVGNRTRDWYVSLNPCLPEVRKYLVGVFRELLSKYDVDGLHMDYIRFPNERVVEKEVIPDYPRDARTLALFRKATGHTPESNPAAWSQWRTDQVTELVADIRKMMRWTAPRTALTAAVGSVRQRGLTHFQDGQAWVQRDLVDALFLMNYTTSPEKFKQRIEPWLAIGGDARIVPGLSVSDKPGTTRGAQIAKEEIGIARQMTGEFCIFAYSSLFDSANTEFDEQGGAVSRKRAERRLVLSPYLRSLAPQNRK